MTTRRSGGFARTESEILADEVAARSVQNGQRIAVCELVPGRRAGDEVASAVTRNR